MSMWATESNSRVEEIGDRCSQVTRDSLCNPAENFNGREWFSGVPSPFHKHQQAGNEHEDRRRDQHDRVNGIRMLCLVAHVRLKSDRGRSVLV